jgi:hypothetical protein
MDLEEIYEEIWEGIYPMEFGKIPERDRRMV